MRSFFLIMFLFSTIFAQSKPSFSIQENGLVLNNYTEISPDLVDTKFVLYGRLHDTGKSNLFHEYCFTNNTFVVRNYIVINRIYKSPRSFMWGQITGKYSKIVASRIEIEIQSYSPITDMDKRLQKSVEYCQDILEQELPLYDLNQFKKSRRFQQALTHLEGMDFNTAPYTRAVSAKIFWDMERMIVGIECGRSKLFESPIRGDFLSYLAVYDLSKKQLIEIQIANTGYFLE